MATVTMEGTPLATSGDLPEEGTKAPDFRLVDGDLQEHTLADYRGRWKVLNIVPSLDTPVCAAQARRFTEEAASLADTTVLVVSADLPFAQNRFARNEGTRDLTTLSTVRSPDFGRDYGVLLEEGPLAGICARAVLVIDGDDNIRHSQRVREITDEPDYGAALAALR